MQAKAFTLIETLLVIAFIGILLGLGISALRFTVREAELGETADGLMRTLRSARERTLRSDDASQYGVRFATSSVPAIYTLFKGPSYALRDSSADVAYRIPKDIVLFDVELGGGTEVVFTRLTGESSASGSIGIRVAADPGKTRRIYVDASGQVGKSALSIPSDTRDTDARHVHVSYSRYISTTTENLVLDFDGGAVTETIAISGSIEDEEITWEGTVTVGGEAQKLRIHTHRFNSPDTQFSIHRDRRYNNKSLTITLSGDSTGTLVEYAADGLSTTNSSLYAEEPEWQ